MGLETLSISRRISGSRPKKRSTLRNGSDRRDCWNWLGDPSGIYVLRFEQIRRIVRIAWYRRDAGSCNPSVVLFWLLTTALERYCGFPGKHERPGRNEG